MDPKSLEHRTKMKRHFPFQCTIEETAHRAISFEQLKRILKFAAEHSEGWTDTAPRSSTFGQALPMTVLNLYHLNAWLIKPATKDDDCAFVELLASHDQVPSWFVSHWWGERIKDFVTSVTRHVQVRCLDVKEDPKFWVCAYANRQHSLSKELVSDPTQSSFYRALSIAKGVLVILDDQTEQSGPATPFSRIWCAFEQSVALTLSREGAGPLLFDVATALGGDTHVLTDGPAELDMQRAATRAFEDEAVRSWASYLKIHREKMFPFHVIQAGLSLELEKAKASKENDRVSILNCLAGRDLELPPLDKHENYDKVNKMLRAKFATAVWRGAAENKQVRLRDLPTVLSADKYRTAVVLDFSCMETNLLDADVADIARGLPPGLISLELSFYHCKQISSKGVSDLVLAMPSRLRGLRLDLSLCPLYDEGLSALAQMPPALLSLAVSVDSCQVSDAGVSSFACKLPASLQQLRLHLGRNPISDVGATALAEGIPQTLQILKIKLDECKEVGDTGLGALTVALPTKSLQHLTLKFSSCSKISDAGVAALALKLHESYVKRLELGLRGCSKFTDAGMRALVAGMPKSLQTISLNLYDTQVSKQTLPQGVPFWPTFAGASGRLWFNYAPEVLATWTAAAAPAEPAALPRLKLQDLRDEIAARESMKTTLKETFRALDKNRSGYLSLREFRAFCSHLRVPLDKSDALFRLADTDRDGKVSFDEFVDLVWSDSTAAEAAKQHSAGVRRR
eukprot:TRINITY_DN60782_c0_g1_i1.p1 TRINITY_DN60782_c0_g1~~TRINITY_DN60782_c0_g1_i1.p1  ORF type:complete len:755 (+),score=116.58 TRINITY_DN60782_c0_g1_i1:47-2266(+)